MQILDVCKENGLDVSDIIPLLTLMLGKSIKAVAIGNAESQSGLTKCAIEGILHIVTED